MWPQSLLEPYFSIFFYILPTLPLVYLVWPVMSKNLIYIPALWSHFLDLILHPTELLAVIRYLLFKRKRWGTIFGSHDNRKEEAICIKVLTRVSPFTAECVRELPQKLRAPVTIFYLICRTIDCIEDDMSLPTKVKIDQLTSFPSLLIEKEAAVSWKRYLDLQRRHSNEQEKGPNFWRKINKKGGCDNGLSPAELFLLQNFESVIIVYGHLGEEYRSLIFETAQFMSGGMAKFLTKGTIETMADLDEYAYIVAGCVVSQVVCIIDASGVLGDGRKLYQNLSKEDQQKIPAIISTMASFAVMVDSIMDLVEDLSQSIPRTFLPRQIWSKYVTQVDHLIGQGFEKEALLCVNEILICAVQRFPQMLEFMVLAVKEAEKEPDLKWLAEGWTVGSCILMGTLERCYNNENMLKTAVQIRAGEGVQIMNSVHNLFNTFCIFEKYLKKMRDKTPQNDSNTGKAMEALDDALEIVAKYKMRKDEFERGWT